jgi:tetratricopeptide (TPR) repeat protein
MRLVRYPAVVFLTIAVSGLPASANDDDWRVCGNSSGSADSTIIAACSRLIATGKAKDTYYVVRANAYLRQAEFELAIADIDKMATYGKLSAEALSVRGLARARSGDYEQGIADLDRAIMLGRSAMNYAVRGLIYRDKGDIDKAKADFTSAVVTSTIGYIEESWRQTASKQLAELERLSAAKPVPGRASPATTGASPLAVPFGVMPDALPPEAETSPPAIAINPALPDHQAEVSASSGVLGKRVALVIGNSAYSNIGRLDNPANDARLIAGALKDVGFELVGGGPQLDLDKAGLDRAVREFGNLLQGADVGLFYYAGHAVEVRGANYLAPVTANPAREADVDFELLDAKLVVRQMEAAGTRLNLVMLDACRNNPLAGRGFRASGGGLAQMQAPEGTVISFATQPGNVALDGFGKNSPYTTALAEIVRARGLDLFDTLNQVGLRVKRATGGSQQPWYSSSPIEGEFYFAGK